MFREEAHCPHARTVLLAGPPPRSIQISQRWVFLVSPGLPPQPRFLPREEGTGFREHGSRGTATARLRGQGVRGSWGFLKALAHSRLTVTDEVVALGDHKKKKGKKLRSSENSPIALLTCQLTDGGLQLRGEPKSHCHLVPPKRSHSAEVLTFGRTRCPVDTTDSRRQMFRWTCNSAISDPDWGCNIPTPQVGAP